MNDLVTLALLCLYFFLGFIVAVVWSFIRGVNFQPEVREGAFLAVVAFWPLALLWFGVDWMLSRLAFLRKNAWNRGIDTQLPPKYSHPGGKRKEP